MIEQGLERPRFAAHALRFASLVLLITLPLAAPRAQPVPPGPLGHGMTPKPLELRPLGKDVYWSAEGGTVGVIVGPDGVVLVDVTGTPARAGELRRAIAKVTDKPIRAAILTHVDEDHVGGISALPKGIEIIAQRRTAERLRVDAAAGRGPVPADRVPNHVVDRRETVALAGVPIELLNWGPAHTDGDLVVYLPTKKIVVAGDIFCLDQLRAYIKPELGGNSAGWVRSARGVLALDADTILAGHGGVATKAELARYVKTSADERAAIQARVAKGEPLPQIEAEVGEPQPSTMPLKPGQHVARFGQVVYDELAGGR